MTVTDAFSLKEFYHINISFLNIFKSVAIDIEKF